MTEWCANCEGAAHGAILYLALLVLLCHTHCCRVGVRRRSAPLLHNHVVFWLTALVLGVLQVALAAALWLEDGDLHKLITPALGAFAVGGGEEKIKIDKRRLSLVAKLNIFG